MIPEEMKKGLLFISISSFFYALVIVNTKAGLNNGLDSSSFTFLTMAIALFFMVPYYFSKKRKKIMKKDLQNFFLLGLFASGLAHFLLFFGQQYTSAVNAGFLVKITTLFTVVFAFIIIREQLRKIDLLAIAVSFIGVFLLSTEGQFIFKIGDILIVLSSLFLGFSNVFAKRLMKYHSSRTIVFWRTFFGVPILFIFSLFFTKNPFSSFGIYALLNGLFLAITIICLYRTIELIGASLSSTLFFISPIFSTLFAIIILDETLSLIQLLGGMIILIGLYIIVRR